MQVSEFDEDGDGKIDAEELAKQTGISTKRAREIIDQFDHNEDGQIDPKEFEVLKARLIDEHDALEAGQLLSQQSLLTPEEIDMVGDRVYKMDSHIGHDGKMAIPEAM